MKCPRCQTDNAESARFCTDCGASLLLSCPYCGERLSSPVRFCPACGARLIRDSSPGSGGENLTPPVAAPEPGDAQRRQVTVLFCDVVGSTEMSEKLDPEELRDVLASYQETCKKVLARFDVEVAQYLG